MTPILWVASYPRSGNTWLRAFLSNLWAGEPDAAVDINRLTANSAAADRNLFDESLAIDSSDLSHDEVDRLRPAVYRAMAEQQSSPLIVKAHDAYSFNCNGEPLFPADVTGGAIYVVRNPLDVAASLVHFWKGSADEIIDTMGADRKRVLAGQWLAPQLSQWLLSWSGHASSWMDLPSFPVRVVQYEAMCAEPGRTFASVALFAANHSAGDGKAKVFDPDRIARAIEHSSFANLRRQERVSGFRERPPGTDSFFRSGTVGAWRTALSSTQVDRVIDRHAHLMRRLGYLSPEGDVVDIFRAGAA